MFSIGDYVYYYPRSWVTNELRTDNPYYGQKCQITDIHGKLVWLLFADKSVGYAKFAEIKKKVTKDGRT